MSRAAAVFQGKPQERIDTTSLPTSDLFLQLDRCELPRSSVGDDAHPTTHVAGRVPHSGSSADAVGVGEDPICSPTSASFKLQSTSRPAGGCLTRRLSLPAQRHGIPGTYLPWFSYRQRDSVEALGPGRHLIPEANRRPVKLGTVTCDSVVAPYNLSGLQR
ncbi:hypothetical protein N658DRAFT_282814 [Parathielavia hyrcaniae]|uniref:Uncharacterized protein n=1 Tax=Parathielavia hyrcaniae TaxID=113614 RepID=A0AAN6Q501_9PEZI|nr:hypothetical protein N658DRAFT_282814 [Parathielavia hyrcaniae]